MENDDCYGLQNEAGAWFTYVGPTHAAFTCGTDYRTCRYTQEHATRIAAQLACNEPPEQVTIVPLPPLTDVEVQELTAFRNPPRARRRARRTAKR